VNNKTNKMGKDKKIKKIISNRKISFYVNESDKDLKKEYYKTLNDWFYHARHY
jgi:hypothetical protein